MKGDTIIHKTALGLDEMETRTRLLSPSLRAVLIMVDGKSTYDALYQKIRKLPQYSDQNQFNDTIDILLKEDLIRGGSSIDSPGFELQDEVPATELPKDWNPDLMIKIKRRLVHAAGEVLDRQAGKVIHKLENAPDSKEGIIAAMNDSKKLVRLFIDEEKADELERKFNALVGESS